MSLNVPDVLAETCATRQALERLGSKWRVLLVYALLAGPQRPAELRRRLPGISQKVLTETLRGMEADGLVQRRIVKADPPQHVEYAVTELGATLEEPLAAICRWASEHPASQHPGSEHPAGEHPASERRPGEHPASERRPGEHPAPEPAS